MPLTVLVGDAGSASKKVAIDMGCDAVEAGNSLLYFDTSGDISFVSLISSFVNYLNNGSARFYVNSFIRNDFREKYEIPSFDEILKHSDVMATAFPCLARSEPGKVDEAANVLIGALDALNKFERKENVFLVVTDFDVFDLYVKRRLMILSLIGVNVVLTCSYKAYEADKSIVDCLNGKFVFMKKHANEQGEAAAGAVEQSMFDLPAGKGFYLDGTSLQSIEFKAREYPLKEIKFANALRDGGIKTAHLSEAV